MHSKVRCYPPIGAFVGVDCAMQCGPDEAGLEDRAGELQLSLKQQ